MTAETTSSAHAPPAGHCSLTCPGSANGSFDSFPTYVGSGHVTVAEDLKDPPAHDLICEAVSKKMKKWRMKGGGFHHFRFSRPCNTDRDHTTLVGAQATWEEEDCV